MYVLSMCFNIHELLVLFGGLCCFVILGPVVGGKSLVLWPKSLGWPPLLHLAQGQQHPPQPPPHSQLILNKQNILKKCWRTKCSKGRHMYMFKKYRWIGWIIQVLWSKNVQRLFVSFFKPSSHQGRKAHVPPDELTIYKKWSHAYGQITTTKLS